MRIKDHPDYKMSYFLWKARLEISLSQLIGGKFLNILTKDFGVVTDNFFIVRADILNKYL